MTSAAVRRHTAPLVTTTSIKDPSFKLSLSTKQYQTFYKPDALPVTQPTVSKHSPSLCFNGHFPGGPRLASTRMSPFWILLVLRVMEVLVTTGAIRHAMLQSKCHQQANTQFLQTGCPSCHLNSVKALKALMQAKWYFKFIELHYVG